MSIYTDNRYQSSLLSSQKADYSYKYSVPSISKDNYQGYKPETQSYTNPTVANYAASRGLAASMIKQPAASKAYDPTSYMPPIKRTESYLTSNYPSTSTTSKPPESLLTRDLNKRNMVPSPQAQGPRPGVSIERTYAAPKDYPISSYTSTMGQVSAAAAYANDRSGLYERKFMGIDRQIKAPAITSNSSRKGQYGYQDSQDDVPSPSKLSKGQSDIYTRSNSKYGDPYYVSYGESGDREGSGRSGTSAMANDRSIGSMARVGELERTPSDAYSRKNLSNLQSNNYMGSSINPTYALPRNYENDSYDSKSTLLTRNVPPSTSVVKSSASGAWVPSEPKGLVGLRNIGNTCFMNSILQSLFNAPELSDFLASGKFMSQINHKREKGIARSFADILSKIRSHVGSPSYSAESTYALKRKIEESNAMFSGYEQHDAQEFLKALLEGIHEDLNRVNEKPPYKELKAEVTRPLQTISSEWYDYMLGRDNSIITDLFSGQLLSRTTCTHCGYESLAFDNFWDLSLSFTRGLSMLGGCDLLRMIEQFLKEEQLEDLFNCERCKQKRKFKKCFVIWRLPKVLVIHLKRFHYGKYKKEKITQNVKFPVHDLDLSEFVKESKDISVKDAHYSLFGIVNHSGSLNGGHYTAECMNPFNRKWYNFNDSSVRESHAIDPRDEEAEGESPYILFYVKK